MARYWPCSWSRCNGALVIICVAILATGCGPTPDERVRHYVEAANRHDLEAVEAMLADEVVWFLGPDTLTGKHEVLAPLNFDTGAQTHLELREITARGDTAEFEMAEHNRVLMALGIHELVHHTRFVFRDGLIVRKEEIRQPGGIEAFADSVASFANWLYVEEPEAYDRIWGPGGKFVYSQSTAELMLLLVDRWRAR
jgi:hypothetical protein